MSQGANRNARNTPIFPLTPTSTSASNFPPQQLSPNFPLPGAGSRSSTLFGPQRPFAPPTTDRRPMSGLGGSSMPVMGNFSRNYGTGIYDPSEFPSLTNRAGGEGGGQVDNLLQPSQMPGKQPYVGMVKAPTVESSEFQISSEDFPALPGTSIGGGKDGSVVPATDKQTPQTPQSSDSDKNIDSSNKAPGAERQTQPSLPSQLPSQLQQPQLPPPLLQQQQHHQPQQQQQLQQQQQQHQQQQQQQLQQHQSQDRGIITHPDGRVTNIPTSMVKNQFGIVGLLTFIRVAETEPSLVAMSLGQDLKNLGLNLNSPENIYPNFGGPFADMPCRPQDIDYHVPQEYLINAAVRDKLPIPKLNHYKEDLLFYFFYCYPGDSVQLAAASELYNRDWRYHTEEKQWISRAPGTPLLDKTTAYERGTYLFFDPHKWHKVIKDFHLEYSKLEERPPSGINSAASASSNAPPPQHNNMYPPPGILSSTSTGVM